MGGVGNLNCHGLILMKEILRRQFGQQGAEQEPVKVLPQVLLVQTQQQ